MTPAEQGALSLILVVLCLVLVRWGWAPCTCAACQTAWRIAKAERRGWPLDD